MLSKFRSHTHDYTHFTDGETEAPEEVTFPQALSQRVAELGTEPRPDSMHSNPPNGVTGPQRVTWSWQGHRGLGEGSLRLPKGRG